MTAISRKVKSSLNKSRYIPNTQHILGAVGCLLAGLSAGVSRWLDLPMAATAFILAYCIRDKIYYCILMLGITFSAGFLSFDNRAYLAYFLGAIIFVVIDNFTEIRKMALAGSCVTIGTAKLFLAYSSMSFDYKLLAVIEPAIVYIGAVTAQAGLSVLNSGKNSRSFTDVVCSLVTMLALSLSLCGADSHFLYVGMAVSLGLGWFYISNGCMDAATVCFLSGIISAYDKIGFTYLFICLVAIIIAGGFFAEKLSLAFYPAVFFSAVLANIVFISNFNSFALLGSAVGALVVYTVLPYLPYVKISPPSNTFIGGRDWRLLMLSLKKLENSLSFLAGSVIDISKLNEKNTQPLSLEDMVAEDVCRRCDKNTYCWQEKYSFTQQQFSRYGEKMHWAGENRFSSGFCAQCINVSGVLASFEENSRLLLSRKYIALAQKNNQKLLQNAFLAVSGAVGDLIYQNQRSQLINTTITMEMHRFLGELSVGHSYCLCSQNPDKASFAVVNPVDEKRLYKIRSRLEYLYGVKFSEPYVEQQSAELIYIFDSRPVYSYDMAVETSRYKRINGDNTDVFVHNGSVYVILSDGMGTGRQAAAESRTVVAMAKSLITTGVSMKNVIDIVNLALNLKGSGENSASVDILQINLSDGTAHITKAGAGVSLVLTAQGLTRYYQDSLPLGILKDVKPVQCDFRLAAGDTVILMSDGAGVISGTLKDMHSATCQSVADAIMEENKTQDDKTVIVLRLKINI
ncbi:MAG: SpoIIE family protein phosphatase [Oscillospiraceae bacterium]|nr:SpoIIE family protein phosphatase [Oscillospiraceae bacterium]